MEKKNTKKIIIGVAILLVAVVALFFVYKAFAPKTTAGSKNITVTVVHADKTSKDFAIATDEEYLGAAMQAEKLVDGSVGDYGLYITTADKETADDSKQQWWCLTKGGEMVNTSADTTPISDGDKFELTLTEGY